MGFLDTIKDASDSVRKIKLQNRIEIDKLYDLILNSPEIDSLGKPELKKGITGNAVVFPKKSRVTPRITVKDDTVTVKKIIDSSTTSVGVGGFSFALDKDLAGGNAISTTDAGSTYFKSVAAAVEKILEGK